MKTVLLLVVGLGLSVAQVLSQTPYRAANSVSTIHPRQYGFVSIDLAEATIGLTFTKELGSSGVALYGYGGASARKDQDFFSKIEFIPGVELGGRVAWVVGRGGPSHTLLFVGGGYSTIQRRIAQLEEPMNPASAIALSEPTQRTVTGVFGVNHSFSNATFAGVGFEGRREFKSPGPAIQQEVCVPGTTGGVGAPNNVLICSDRFIGAVEDRWVGHARGDVMFRVANLGPPDGTAKLAVITAASVDILENAGDPLNFALGSAITHRDFPGQIVVALLLELGDAFDANSLFPDLSDRLVLRIAFGIPFKQLLSN